MLLRGLVFLEEQGISKSLVCTFGQEAIPLNLTFPLTHAKTSTPEILYADFSDFAVKIVIEDKCLVEMIDIKLQKL